MTFTDDNLHRRLRTAIATQIHLRNTCNSTGNPFASLAFGYGDNISASSQLVVTPSVANRVAGDGVLCPGRLEGDPETHAQSGLALPVEFAVHVARQSDRVQQFQRRQWRESRPDQPAGGCASGGGHERPGDYAVGRIELPVVDAGARHHAIPDVEHEDGSDLLERRWAETRFLVPARSEDGGAGRGGHLFRNEPGHKLPVSRLSVPQDREPVLYERQFRHQSATLENPFPGGFSGPQGTQYTGQFANWGYQNPNDLGTMAARDANIYQWNLESSSRSPARSCSAWTTPPTEARICRGPVQTTALSSLRSLLAQITAAVTPTDSTCSADSCVSNFLQTQVGNPFYSMFNTPCTLHSCLPSLLQRT